MVAETILLCETGKCAYLKIRIFNVYSFPIYRYVIFKNLEKDEHVCLCVDEAT